jgi:hypothetical protein
MKPSLESRIIPEWMRPSKFSSGGFSGTDQRPVEKIIEADRDELKKMKVAKAALVKALKGAFEKARSALGLEVNIADGVSAIYYESRGKIPSPFKDDGLFEKGEVVVTNRRTKQTVFLTALSIHLIEKYGFFQGKGSKYRIEPAQAVQVLGIKGE